MWIIYNKCAIIELIVVEKRKVRVLRLQRTIAETIIEDEICRLPTWKHTNEHENDQILGDSWNEQLHVPSTSARRTTVE
jgi:hypothetical protein